MVPCVTGRSPVLWGRAFSAVYYGAVRKWLVRCVMGQRVTGRSGMLWRRA
jgi:hypothetical protein